LFNILSLIFNLNFSLTVFADIYLLTGS